MLHSPRNAGKAETELVADISGEEAEAFQRPLQPVQFHWPGQEKYVENDHAGAEP